VFPTRRRTVQVNPDNTTQDGPIGVAIDIIDIQLS
jgi:hypothetical protein